MQDGQNEQLKDDPAQIDAIVEDGSSPASCPSCGLAVSANTLVCPNDGTKLTATLSGDSKLSDKYEFLSKLAEGGMGAVYKVRHKMLDKVFAIKILHANMSSHVGVKRFKREAQTTMELRHPGIVAVHDFGVSDQGQPFIVMEFATGKTLSQLIASHAQLPLSAVVSMFQQIAEAIAYAHRKGVVHRDIKPSNIMIEEGEDGTMNARVLDFGIARIPQTDGNTLTTTGEVFGSPGYMSPEQCSGQVPDQRSDVYSLGCTLYETLTKRPVFVGANSLELVYKHSNEAPLSLTNALDNQSKFPEALEDVVRIALSKNRDDRFASMNEFADALSRVQSQKRITRGSTRTGARSKKLVLLVIPLAVLALAVPLLWYLHVLPAPLPSPLPTTATYAVGQKLEVNWHGVWYPAEVLLTDGTKAKIHYLTYDHTSDDWVLPYQLHTIGNAAGGAKPVQFADIKLGTGNLEVEWHGHWYKCDVLKLQNGKAFIHFSGYDHKDDRWVTPDLLRTVTISDAPEPSK